MRRVFPALLAIALLAMFAFPSSAKVLIEVDKSTQTMVVTVDGQVRHQWPVSTGRLAHDTPEGDHRAFRLERDHFSKEWDDAPMPHSIFFTKRGHAIHGSFDVKRIGTPASAGCVRLAPENAAKLFALVEERGVLNATVVITGDVRTALARETPAVASTPTQRRARARANDDAAIWPEERAQRREDLDTYASRMRQRYERERPTYAPRSYDDAPEYGRGRSAYEYDYQDQYDRPVRSRRYRPDYGWW